MQHVHEQHSHLDIQPRLVTAWAVRLSGLLFLPEPKTHMHFRTCWTPAVLESGSILSVSACVRGIGILPPMTHPFPQCSLARDTAGDPSDGTSSFVAGKHGEANELGIITGGRIQEAATRMPPSHPPTHPMSAQAACRRHSF